MRDFTAFDLEIEKIEKEHFHELSKPLNHYYTIFIDTNDNCQVVWEDSTCPSIIRNKVIYAYRLLP
ncbi:hypothetical protein [Mucilaginibacter sp.]|uniref:hypothetical protein n=1 Tax=Mucilaginibacter sp. TaxID=1882438 RepID=UPI0028529DD1|nr:hypothetical protein [Mucilaginibacter sp.]